MHVITKVEVPSNVSNKIAFHLGEKRITSAIKVLRTWANEQGLHLGLGDSKQQVENFYLELTGEGYPYKHSNTNG